MQTNYAECERRVLLSEGGYTNDPRDPGGPTNWGITLVDARLHWKPNATAGDVFGMPRSVAEAIYKAKYWDALGCDELPSGVDYTVFDYGVNSGIHRSARVLKAAQAVSTDPVKIVDYINDERLQFLHVCSHNGVLLWPSFGRGWGRRVASVKAFSEHLALTPPSTTPPPHYTMEPCAKAYDGVVAPKPTVLLKPAFSPLQIMKQAIVEEKKLLNSLERAFR